MLISAAQLLDVTLLGPGRILLACLPICLNLTSKSGSGVKSLTLMSLGSQ